MAMNPARMAARSARRPTLERAARAGPGLAIAVAALVLASPSASAQPVPWTFSVHGYAFLTANRQGGPSGDRDFESQNHFMLAATRPLGGGTLSLLGTFTLEPLT